MPEHDVQKIVRLWLIEHGYDGLFNGEDCGCSLDDLMPCNGEGCLTCVPGYRRETPGGESDFLIYPTKEAAHDKTQSNMLYREVLAKAKAALDRYCQAHCSYELGWTERLREECRDRTMCTQCRQERARLLTQQEVEG